MPGREKYYDAVLLWGLSTPYLDPWEMARTYSAICYLLSDLGVMAMEEIDRIFNIFYRVGYKDFLIEGESRKGVTVATIHLGYDERRGLFRRASYTLPGFEEVAKLDFKFWDIASLAAMGWLFFKDVDLVPPSVRKIPGLRDVTLYRAPEKYIARRSKNGAGDSALYIKT